MHPAFKDEKSGEQDLIKMQSISRFD